MKKALALALVLVLVVSLCACGAKTLAGDWTLTGLSLNGEERSSLLSMLDVRLSFRSDGTGTVFSGEDEIPLTWDKGTFSDGRDTFHYTLNGDELSFEAEGMTFLFTRG